ncbi:MauE/DoxX family redox-associated membrane protein [Sphingobacterium hungaricum]
MMMPRKLIVITLLALLLLLWIPACLDKILHFAVFKNGMLAQPISTTFAKLLSYAVPIAEIIIILLLLIPRLQLYGCLLSSALLFAFSAYILLMYVADARSLPCICGSLIPQLGWFWHLWFNLLFLALSIGAYVLIRNLKQSNYSGSIVAAGGSAKRSV